VILIDTNVLVRLRDESSPEHASCRRALEAAADGRLNLVCCAQVIIEYWVVATRPKDVNGLGVTPEVASADLYNLLDVIDLIPEPPDVGARWLNLVTTHRVFGRPTHDARIVALMEAESIRQILTLNPADFARYKSIECLSPDQLLTSAP
jgi:predicted nucleic acid-binding protein